MTAFILTFCVGILHLLWYYRSLPDTVASHFDTTGRADGWAPKGMFIAAMAGVYCVVAGLFMGVWTTMRKFPPTLINIPKRDYWMSPPREAATRIALSRMFLWLGWASIALLVVMMELTFRANLREDQHLGRTPWFMLGIYLVFNFWMIGRLLYHFIHDADRDKQS